MDPQMRSKPPSKVAAALEQLAAKRAEQEARRQAVAQAARVRVSEEDEKENAALPGDAHNQGHKMPSAAGHAVPSGISSSRALQQASRMPLPVDSSEGEDTPEASASEPEDEDASDDMGKGGHRGAGEDESLELLRRIQATCLGEAPAGSTGTAGAAALPPMVLGEKQDFKLDGLLASKLYPHQVEGVKWLYSLYESRQGGILGDDMGLGKTMQCCAFLAGLFRSRLAQRVLVVAPKTLLLHWAKELGVCGLGGRTWSYFGDSVSERDAALRAVTSQRGSGGIMLTTYGMVLHHHEKLRIRVGGIAAGGRSSGGGTGSSGSGGGAGRGKAAAEEEDAAEEDADDPSVVPWDCIFLDEGHKVKNPHMKLAAALRRVPARLRVIISGTPIQNNLLEMHALFDYVNKGLLGSRRSFAQTYAKFITTSQNKDATESERVKGAAVARALREVIAPFFLRREKQDVLKQQDSSTANDASAPAANGAGSSSSSAAAAGGTSASTTAGASAGMQDISRKNDLVVWLRMTPLQLQIYKAFLKSEAVAAALNQTASVLAALTVLKKVCDHPGLLSANATSSVISGSHRWAKQAGQRKKGGTTKHGYSADDDFVCDDSEDEVESSSDSSDGGSSGEDSDDGGRARQGQAQRRPGGKGKGDKGGAEAGRGGAGGGQRQQQQQQPGEEEEAKWLEQAKASLFEQNLLQEIERKGADASCKSLFVLSLLPELTARGHRTLIFSQSRVMLDILEAGIKAQGLTMCRIDGTVVSAEERQAEVQRFQRPGSNIPVFLLTSQVGGLGLTLTAADRVIIIDPNWNPALDNQSVDRAYRIGQKRNVVVYRLITCGTVEEKIYRRQVFKGGLSRTGTQQGIQFRYFATHELRDLFTVDDRELAESQTQRQLHELHSHERRTDESLEGHLRSLQSIGNFAGVSDHDLLFSSQAQEQEPSAEQGRDFISQAEGRLAGSSSGASALADQLGASLSLGKPMTEADKARAALQQQQKRVLELEQQRARQQGLLGTLGVTLADGGQKIRLKISELEDELLVQRRKLEQLQAGPQQQSQHLQQSQHPAVGGLAGAGAQACAGGATSTNASLFAGSAGAAGAAPGGMCGAGQQVSSSGNMSSGINSGAGGFAQGMGSQPPPPPQQQQQQQQQQRSRGLNITFNRSRQAGDASGPTNSSSSSGIAVASPPASGATSAAPFGAHTAANAAANAATSGHRGAGGGAYALGSGGDDLAAGVAWPPPPPPPLPAAHQHSRPQAVVAAAASPQASTGTGASFVSAISVASSADDEHSTAQSGLATGPRGPRGGPGGYGGYGGPGGYTGPGGPGGYGSYGGPGGYGGRSHQPGGGQRQGQGHAGHGFPAAAPPPPPPPRQGAAVASPPAPQPPPPPPRHLAAGGATTTYQAPAMQQGWAPGGTFRQGAAPAGAMGQQARPADKVAPVVIDLTDD